MTVTMIRNPVVLPTQHLNQLSYLPIPYIYNLSFTLRGHPGAHRGRAAQSIHIQSDLYNLNYTTHNFVSKFNKYILTNKIKKSLKKHKNTT